VESFLSDAPSNRYDFVSPLSKELIGSDSFFGALIQTKAVQRLRNIRFLGSIDYAAISSPNGLPSNTRYTRYQHSLGVARLALYYSDIAKLSQAEKRLSFAIALLHDVGHPPFSHSAESIFHKHFQLDHHLATRFMILGEAPLGRELFSTLKRFNVSPMKIVDILDKSEADPFHGFFSGPINFDTIEGILRSHLYLNSNYMRTDPFSVLKAAFLKGDEVHKSYVDNFWIIKNTVYNVLINSRIGVTADYNCKKIIENNIDKLDEVDFFHHERKIFRKIPELKSLIARKNERNFRINPEIDKIEFSKRYFYIDNSINFFSERNAERYKQNKIKTKM